MGIPSIAVIVAVRNAVGTLARCLDSVLEQRNVAVELLVADGASTDGSIETVRLRAERLAWWDTQSDTGVYAAWNRALPHVRGEWVLFLGADDWLPETDGLARLAVRLAEVPEVVRVAYGPVRVVSPTGREIAIEGRRPWHEARERMRRSMALPHQGVFHRRSLFAGGAGFDASYRIAGDYEFLLRELTNGAAAYLGAEPVVANMTVGGLSMHGSHILEHVREIRRARERHGVFYWDAEYAGRWVRAALRAVGNGVLGPRCAGRWADRVRRWRRQPPIWSVE